MLNLRIGNFRHYNFSASKALKRRLTERELLGWCEVRQKLFPGPGCRSVRGNKRNESPRGAERLRSVGREEIIRHTGGTHEGREKLKTKELKQ